MVLTVCLCKREIYHKIKRDFCEFVQLIFVKRSARILVKML